VLINSEAGLLVRWGGRGEGLRRNRGDAVGVKAGASLIERFQVNVVLTVVDLADGVVVRVADERGVEGPRPLVADGAVVGFVPGRSAW
jgi:hypothetical protein